MAGELHILPGTAVVFGSEAGDDVDWSTENISNGAGRISAEWDRGSGARPNRYLFEFWCQLQATTPVVGQLVRLYLVENGGEGASSDHPASDLGTADAAVTSEDKLLNLRRIGEVRVDEAAADTEMGFKTITEVEARHVQLVLWNGSGAALTNDAAETKARLTPMPYQVQS